MKAKYIRVSTLDQNPERQFSKNDNVKIYEDKLSGLIPFHERPAGKRLIEDIQKGKINHLTINSIDRLGRNVVAIQSQLNWFVEKRIQVYLENIQMNLLNNDGTLNPIAKMIIDLLGSVASLEIEAIKERQRQGVELAKIKGNVYLGRQVGAVMSTKDFMKRHKDVISLLKDGLSLNKVSKLTGKAFITVKKVNCQLQEKV